MGTDELHKLRMAIEPPFNRQVLIDCYLRLSISILSGEELPDSDFRRLYFRVTLLRALRSNCVSIGSASHFSPAEASDHSDRSVRSKISALLSQGARQVPTRWLAKMPELSIYLYIEGLCVKSHDIVTGRQIGEERGR